MATKTIKVDVLARVEGEGGLTIKYRDGQVKDVLLRIFEPPRFFEALLRGRGWREPPDITARICGICPVAYQMSACNALESALGVEVGPDILALRRLLYCGEWIESHLLHVFFLHAPDFLGAQDALEIAQSEPELVRSALRAKKVGNSLLSLLGGREIHPVNVRVGGFYRAPDKSTLEALLPELRWALDFCQQSVERFATLAFPEVTRDYVFVALKHPTDYPLTQGRIVSSAGLDIDPARWPEHFIEEQVPHSNALHARFQQGGGYLVGPLARFNLCFDQLTPRAAESARRVGLVPPVSNPFRGLLVRLVESIFAFEEAIRLIEGYRPPTPTFVEPRVRAGVGHGASEAPRGTLYHRYNVARDGSILDATIVPPTSQNLRTIEEDLRDIAPRLLTMPRADATWLAEQTVRNYDPCISCATHFLSVTFEEV